MSEQPERRPTFDDMPLSDEMRKALAEMSYEHPTPVQTAVWAPAAAGKDLVVQARTGTGKTTAFGLPLVDRLIYKNKRQAQALILCPTRELALQVSRELERLAAHKGVSLVAIYGGAPMGRQVDALAAGAQIVAGTPGRVLDHLRRGTLDPSGIRALVLDEADEMLSMGFERELTSIIERLPKERQTLLFSATVPPDIERMARTRLREPEFVILSGDQVGALEILHFVYMVSEDKKGALIQVIDIEDPESAIVFCNTREQTERVAQTLARHGFEADWLNGDLPQSERENVMRRTREGKLRFLVATDVAARGIDISHLTHVINYDFPQDAESYVHRTGRTGRAGRTGTAISLVTPQDIGGLYILRLTYKIRPVERQLPSRTEERTRLEADLVRSLAETYAARGDREQDRALARRLLTHDDAERIIAGMVREHLAQSPELAEVSQSRRRGRTPEPVPNDPPAQERPRPAARRQEPRPERREEPKERTIREEPQEAPAREEPTEAIVARTEPRRERPQREGPRREEARREGPRRDRVRPRRGDDEGSESHSDRAVSEKVEALPRARALESGPKADAKRDAVAEVSFESAFELEERKAEGGAATEPRRRRRRSRQADAPAPQGALEPVRASAPRERRSGSGTGPVARPIEVVRSDDDNDDDDDDGPIPEGHIELHVDVGRRDGARARTIKGILADGGIAPEQVHRVRVRERYSFVEVDAETGVDAIEVLAGSTLGDRPIRAGISQRSRS